MWIGGLARDGRAGVFLILHGLEDPWRSCRIQPVTPWYITHENDLFPTETDRILARVADLSSGPLGSVQHEEPNLVK